MTPEQFLTRLKSSGPEPAYLFLGPEAFDRDRCRRALVESVLPEPEQRDEGLTRHDLYQTSLAEALDDARSFSLFATLRLIWLAGAENAVPRAASGASEKSGDLASLEQYLADPPADTVLVIDCSRYGFEGDDKTRIQRVEKYFSAIKAKVEFRPYSPEAARALAQRLAKEAGLQLGLAELAVLLETLGGDAARIATEIEKLSLYVGTGRKVTVQDLMDLVPDAHAANIFALVAALGRGDRSRALELLDTLSREGEYMPLALTFLGTQFRLALAAREARLTGARQIQAHFTRLGTRMWPDRARQVEETVRAFPNVRLERAVAKVFEADRALRDARPDDRIVMEKMILELTA